MGSRTNLECSFCDVGWLNYLFSEGIYMLEAKHSSQNPASGRVLEKVGMKRDAVLRSRRIDKKTLKRYDLVIYSITRNEQTQIIEKG